ncbi:MAG: glycosyltransferase family 4 protein [Patescibacteria group bacterium]|jgi:glycosyltransferase involved in cell wall biosynthesis
MVNQGPILLMVTSQDWGGAQAYLLNLAKDLSSRGLPVKVCAGGKGELGARCREANIEFIELKHMARDINPIHNLLSLFELISLFKKLKPRAVHLNSSMMGVVGSLAAGLTKVPSVIYVAHGWVFNEALSNLKKNFYIWLEKFSARWKDVIICVNPKDEALAESLKIKPREKVIAIPNGIDVKEFEQQLMDKEEAYSALVGMQDDATVGRCDGGTIVGTIANAYPPKNLIWYLGVCQAVHEQNPQITFIIIGDGPQMNELRQKHSELNQKDYVLLTGRRLDAPRLYRAFDLFVLPSTKEGMSTTLLEAMASSVPCVATDVGANRWCLGQAGLIVNVNDKEAMIKAILNLAQDKNLRETLSSQAYQAVKLRFDWQRTVEAMIRIIS